MDLQTASPPPPQEWHLKLTRGRVGSELSPALPPHPVRKCGNRPFWKWGVGRANSRPVESLAGQQLVHSCSAQLVRVTLNLAGPWNFTSAVKDSCCPGTGELREG